VPVPLGGLRSCVEKSGECESTRLLVIERTVFEGTGTWGLAPAPPAALLCSSQPQQRACMKWRGLPAVSGGWLQAPLAGS
jgi:hypothetical protein